MAKLVHSADIRTSCHGQALAVDDGVDAAGVGLASLRKPSA
jgi:hypothetical protein